MNPERRSCAGVVRSGDAGGGGGNVASGRVGERDGVGGTPVSVGRRGTGGLGCVSGGGVRPISSDTGLIGAVGFRCGFGVSKISGGRACSRMSGGGSLATVRSSSSKKRSDALCSTVLSAVFSSVLSKIWVSSSSSSHPIADGTFFSFFISRVASFESGVGGAPTREPVPTTAARRETSFEAPTGAAICRYCSILALSSSISAAKVFFIQPARSLRE